MRYLACIIGFVVVLLLAIPVAAGEITITKDLSELVPGQEVSYGTDFWVDEYHPATWTIKYSDVSVVNGWIGISTYAEGGLTNYVFCIEFEDNGALVVSFAHEMSNTYGGATVGNYTYGDKVVVKYDLEKLVVELYNGDQLVNSTTIDDVAMMQHFKELGIALISTDAGTHASGSMTITISYYTSGNSGSNNNGSNNNDNGNNDLQKPVEQVSKTIQDTAVKTVPPLMSLGVLLLGLKKIEEILSSLMR